ncbi:ABC transporter substrate-binding protein [Actinospica robiniae]|uniref:ABC transporter substrate-binding protein n=1 Tax=Actinospica robiniae TaxID=304901 RepID=UPI0006856054|nr:extracellular solute-binding protein [Actinospica robiniae]
MRGISRRFGGRFSRTALALTVVSGLTLTAAGCNSSSLGGDGALVVYTYGDGSTDVQQQAVSDFNKTSKVQVKLVTVPGANYASKLRMVMSSPVAPDVFFNWGGGSIEPYVKADQLVDLTPYFNEAPLKDAFLPSVVSAGAVDGKDYGVPMRGMQPVVLFYNKTLFAQYGLQAPNTWDAMQTAVTTLKAHGITPFALGDSDNWPSLMWLEYLLDRVGGASVFQKIQSGDASAWSDPAMSTALNDINLLIKEGAFGSTFTSENYTSNAAPTLLGTGKAGMQLMGSWDYANQVTNHASFAENDEAWTTFPTVPGGTGDPADVVGNPANYWSISARTKNLATAIKFVQFMTQTSYEKDQLAGGNMPTNTDAGALLPSYPNSQFLQFQYQTVQKAPSFQLSWDQALPTTVGTPLDTEVGRFFAGQVSVSQFESDMTNLQKNVG